MDAMINSLKKFWNRNNKILNCSSRKTKKNCVNLHWWSMNRKDHIENIGDYLSLVVCNYMLDKRSLTFDIDVGKTKHLYAIGSIIQGGMQNATIWGSGLKGDFNRQDKILNHFRKLDIRLVRGPETRRILCKNRYKCDENYGDPALLMPLIYSPNVSKKRDYLVVLHKDTELKLENSIMPLGTDYHDFIDRLNESKKVISSSLHGIILAEAYGIPAILLKDTESSNLFKYRDYYYSTGRFDFPIANNIEEALEMSPCDIPNLEPLQKKILKTFPYDLWNTK